MSALKHVYEARRCEMDPSFGWITLTGHTQPVRVKLNAEGVPCASALRAVGAKEAESAWPYKRAQPAQSRWWKRQKNGTSVSDANSMSSSVADAVAAQRVDGMAVDGRAIGVATDGGATAVATDYLAKRTRR